MTNSSPRLLSISSSGGTPAHNRGEGTGRKPQHQKKATRKSITRVSVGLRGEGRGRSVTAALSLASAAMSNPKPPWPSLLSSALEEIVEVLG